MSHIIAFTNAEHDKCPPCNDAIRAETLMSGYLISKIDENTTHLILISQTDIKGYVPNWIVNYAASKAPVSWLKRLKKGIQMIQQSKHHR